MDTDNEPWLEVDHIFQRNSIKKIILFEETLLVEKKT